MNMGGVTSCFQHQQRNFNQNHRTSTPRAKGHRRNLSATFNLCDVSRDMTLEQLNLNTSTEEELMTLPGIDRQTARNIVDYRHQIGGFKKIEDLALVSGVGATKLNQIRFEICVGKKRPSQTSTPSGSKHDISLTDRGSTRQTPVKVNVNTSNVFQLMKVKLIGQHLAENIVAHRDRKGPFKSLDDLIKVKGIKSAVLSAIRPYLILDGESQKDIKHMNGNAYPVSSQTNYKYCNGDLGSYSGSPSHSSTMGVVFGPSVVQNSVEDLLSTYGPIIEQSHRPTVMAHNFSHKGRPVTRVGSWNLDNFCSAKAENIGVKEVVCMTLLEQGISIMAVQDLLDDRALEKVCTELNTPTLPKVKRWPRPQGRWSSVTSPVTSTGEVSSNQDFRHVGYLWDNEHAKLLGASTFYVNKQESSNTASPYLATFQLGQRNVLVVNIATRRSAFPAQDSSGELAKLLSAVRKHHPDQKHIVIVGNKEQQTRKNGLHQGPPAHTPGCHGDNLAQGHCSASMNNTQNQENSSDHDIVYMTEETQQVCTGQQDVVRSGLSSPWIPDGWKWGGRASSYNPVWIELYNDSEDSGAPPAALC